MCESFEDQGGDGSSHGGPQAVPDGPELTEDNQRSERESGESSLPKCSIDLFEGVLVVRCTDESSVDRVRNLLAEGVIRVELAALPDEESQEAESPGGPDRTP